MNYKEIDINGTGFDYNGTHFNCEEAIKRDSAAILREALINHYVHFGAEYDGKSLKPVKVRVFLDEKDFPQFGMVLYEIKNIAQDYTRTACGNYYPIFGERLHPHFFQGSICW